MPTVTSLPDPTDIASFRALDAADAFETTYPVFERASDGSVQRVIGMLLYLNQTTYALAYNPDTEKWERVTTSDRENRVFDDFEEFDHRNVVLVGDDIETELATWDALYERLRALYGDVFDGTLDEESPDGQRMFDEGELTFECTCGSDRNHSYIPVTETVHVRRCDECTSLPGIRFQGTYVDSETVLSESWLADDTDPIHTQSSDAVFMSVDGEEPTRIDAAMHFLTFATLLTDYRMTPYNPEAFSACVYTRDGAVTGYATWNDSLPDDEPPILRQVYVLPDRRGERIGAALVDAWMRFVAGDYDIAYLDDPNEAGTGLLDAQGYLPGENRDDTRPLGVPVRVLEPRPAFPEGKENPFVGHIPASYG